MSAFKYRNLIFYLIIIPVLLGSGYLTWAQGKYNLLAFVLIAVACLPFVLQFERKNQTSRQLVLLASLVSLGVVSRLMFFFFPGVNPVAAIVLISGLYFGSEIGFMTGLLIPLLSNVFFTQGPWTPFQMFAYAFLGLLASVPLVKKMVKKSKVALALLGIVAGISYSFMMDVWTVLSIDQFFSFQRYFLVLIPAIPYTMTYVISNVVFLLGLNPALKDRLESLRSKYQLSM